MKAEIFLTSSEYKKLQLELKLKKELRDEISKEFREAADLGDDRENFPLDAAIARQRVNERRIQELEGFLENVKVRENLESSKVKVGSSIEIEKEDGTRRVIKLISTDQAVVSYDRNNVTTDSPIGKAIMNKKEGDVFEISSSNSKTKYKIIKIL